MSRYIQGTAHLDKGDELYQRSAHADKILILRNQGILYSFLIRDDRIYNAAREEKEELPIGTVLLGKVTNVAKQFHGVFFALDAAKGGKERTGYLQMKENACYAPVNREEDGRILCGDEMPVQIIKQAKGSKPPQLTTEYSLAGQLVVVRKGCGNVAYSAKLDEADKRRLEEEFEVWKESLFSKEPEIADFFQKCDITFRTNVSFVEADVWQKELIDLIGQIENIHRMGQVRTVYSRLYEPEAFYLDFIREQSVLNLGEIVTDEKDVYENLSGHPCTASVPVRLYEDKRISLQSVYALNTRLQRLLGKKVYMKSGSYLMIEQTEALVAIDVNSGKAEKKAEPEEFYFRTNLEAVKEVCYQLSARNLSGMILVDFINMKDKRHIETVKEALREETAKDQVTTRFIDFTRLGLAEITRKKTSHALSYTLRDWA